MGAIYVAIGIGAALPGAPAWARFVGVAIVGWAAWSAVEFVVYMRLWRVHGDAVFVPGLGQAERAVTASMMCDCEFVDGGIVRWIGGWKDTNGAEERNLAVNLFVSTKDFRRWLSNDVGCAP